MHGRDIVPRQFLCRPPLLILLEIWFLKIYTCRHGGHFVLWIPSNRVAWPETAWQWRAAGPLTRERRWTVQGDDALVWKQIANRFTPHIHHFHVINTYHSIEEPRH